MKIAIGGDHAGYEYKSAIIEKLKEKGVEVIDKGPFSDASVDYPDHVHPVAQLVEAGEVDFGVLICGSGQGVSITANKYQGVRAALCWYSDIVKLARQHNDANIICLPARFISETMAVDMVDLFLETEFEGGRHKRRVDKISCA